MHTRKKVLPSILISLLMVSLTSVSIVTRSGAIVQSDSLIWSIKDEGIDTNGNGLFDFLKLSVTIEVTQPGYYSVSANGLRNGTDWNSTFVDVSDYAGAYFDVGTLVLNLSFFGPVISASKIVNASLISWFSISYPTGGELRENKALSQKYSYDQFDFHAELTGQIADRGVDTDGDGKYNYLEVSVEISVARPGEYRIYAYGLGKTDPWFWIDISGYGSTYLETGLQTITITFSGAKIYASGGSFNKTQYIELSETFANLEGIKEIAILDRESSVSLSETYLYSQFDTLARLTGKVTDKGVDTDGDLRFDYLEIGVEVEVFESGYYQLSVGPLANSTAVFNASKGVIDMWANSYPWLEPGLRLVNVSFYGPAIFASGIDPAFIVDISLYSQSPEWIFLGNLHDTPLSKTYLHTDFDAHAYLTGKILDKGVDADRSGKYDRLDVGVEVQVEDAGTYVISVEALADETGKNTYYEYYYSTYEQVYLEAGTRVINFSFYCPRMYLYRFSPKMATRIALSERYVSWWWDDWLQQISNASLSRQYMYSEFDAPFRDMEARFTVYPNHSVMMGGFFNYTHMEYPNLGPSIEQKLGISQSGDSTLISTQGKVTLPQKSRYSYWYPYPPYYYYGFGADQWPYNSSKVSANARYSEGALNAGINASVTLPSMVSAQYPFNSSDFNLNLAYSNGVLNGDLTASTTIPEDAVSMLPFDLTDFSLNANYAQGTLEGTITFHILSGYPLGDLTLAFTANRTDISADGGVTVIFGTYPSYPEPIEINEKFVDKIIGNITALQGQGSGSLYELTDGLVEFLSTSTIQKTLLPGETGATVTFNLLFHGDLVGFLAFLLSGQPYSPQYETWYDLLDSAVTSLHNASIEVAYARASATATLRITFEDDLKLLVKDVAAFVNQTIPISSDYWASYARMQLYLLNATFNSIASFNLELSYSSVTKTLVVQFSIVDNLKQLWDDAKKILIEAAPPEMKTFYEQLLNVTYCNVKTAEASTTYEQGAAEFAATVVIEGDFKREVNHVKATYINTLAESYSRYSMSIPWQLYFINQTEVDPSNILFYYKLGETSTYWSFEGLMATPPIEPVEDNGFRLPSFFNLTNAPYESPRFGERLRIIVSGGANGTHTMIVFRSGTVPPPDWVSDDQTSMMWNNQTISGIKDLAFSPRYCTVVVWNGKTYPVTTQSNGTVSPATFDQSHKQITLTIYGQAGTAGYANISIPKQLLSANYNEWIIMINDQPIYYPNYQVKETATHTFLYFTFTYTSPVNIAVVGTTVVPELQTSSILPLLMVIAVAAVAIGKARAKIRRKKQT